MIIEQCTGKDTEGRSRDVICLQHLPGSTEAALWAEM
jgi:hypothetical protein